MGETEKLIAEIASAEIVKQHSPELAKTLALMAKALAKRAPQLRNLHLGKP